VLVTSKTETSTHPGIIGAGLGWVFTNKKMGAVIKDQGILIRFGHNNQISQDRRNKKQAFHYKATLHLMTSGMMELNHEAQMMTGDPLPSSESERKTT
jgi:hypothetical protein